MADDMGENQTNINNVGAPILNKSIFIICLALFLSIDLFIVGPIRVILAHFFTFILAVLFPWLGWKRVMLIFELMLLQNALTLAFSKDAILPIVSRIIGISISEAEKYFWGLVISLPTVIVGEMALLFLLELRIVKKLRIWRRIEYV